MEPTASSHLPANFYHSPPMYLKPNSGNGEQGHEQTLVLKESKTKYIFKGFKGLGFNSDTKNDTKKRNFSFFRTSEKETAISTEDRKVESQHRKNTLTEMLSKIPRRFTNDFKGKDKEETVFTNSTEQLGLTERKASPDLRTMKFHQLSLDDYLKHSFKDLNTLVVYKKNSQSILAVDSYMDDLSKKDCGSVDPTFKKLIRMQKISVDPTVAGSFVNNYDANSQGQIVCDAYHVRKLTDFEFSVVADGCGWSRQAREAAERATAYVSDFLSEELIKIPRGDLFAINLVHLLLQSIAGAHEEIVWDKASAIEAGTTTLNICLAFSNYSGEKYLLTAGVGDCKAFVVSLDKDGKSQIQDVTASKRLNFDPRDPGGRLGPQHGIDPDLTNLSVSCIALPDNQESYVFNMSDGVSDNLEPEQVGISPFGVCKKLNYQKDASIAEDTKWDELCIETRTELTTLFQKQELHEIIQNALNEQKTNPDRAKKGLFDVCEAITSYCHEITAPLRHFMETNPKASQPTDKEKYRGKLDHCTVTAFQC